MELRSGQRLNLKYKGRDFEAIIINPHAFGQNKPSIGLSFSMVERCAGLNHKTLSQWARKTLNKKPDNFSESEPVQYFEQPQDAICYLSAAI